MPLYEYECTKCRERTEILQSVNAPSTGECPVCGGQMRRLLSAPAFQFKGSGWYVTDYGRKKVPEEGTKSKSNSTESKSDTKDTKKSTETSSSSAKESSGT